MTFEDYCTKKKIDSARFKEDDPEQWKALAAIFEQISENSFTQQKKFLINDLRRKYLLSESDITKQTGAAPTAKVSAIKPAIKLK